MKGDRDRYGEICEELSHFGNLVFNINYRSAPKFGYPSQLIDLFLAFNWIKDNASRYGGNLRNIFIAGDSSGAYLVSYLVILIKNPSLLKSLGLDVTMLRLDILGLLLFYGIYDLWSLTKSDSGSLSGHIDSWLNNAENQDTNWEMLSPVSHTLEDYTPVFLCAGEAAQLFEQSQKFLSKLEENNIEVHTLFLPSGEFPDASHLFLQDFSKDCTRVALNWAVEFIEMRLNDAALE